MAETHGETIIRVKIMDINDTETIVEMTETHGATTGMAATGIRDMTEMAGLADTIPAVEAHDHGRPDVSDGETTTDGVRGKFLQTTAVRSDDGLIEWTSILCIYTGAKLSVCLRDSYLDHYSLRVSHRVFHVRRPTKA